MNRMPIFPLAAVALAAVLGSAAAHEGHDHAADPAPTAKVLPRAQAASADFELVAVAHPGRLVLHLDRFASNEPVSGAKLEFESGATRIAATEQAPGTYQVARALPPGRNDFTVSIEAADAVDLLPMSLDVPAEAPAAPAGWPWRMAAAGAAAALALLGLGWRLRRGRRAPVALAALAALLIAPGADADAPAPATASAAAEVAEAPQRLPDGSLFLPKPVQRLYAIRTVVAEAAELPRALEFKGHALPDPNAGGRVQSTVAGRIEPGPKGLPVLGQRVARGEVLAWVVPARDPLARASARAQLDDMDGRVETAARRAARLEQLEGSVARREIESARIELAALQAQRKALGGGLAGREALAAPVAGVVSATSAVAGQVVEARDVLFEILDPQRLMVEAVAYDPAAVAKLSPGAPAAAPDLGAKLAFVGAGRALREQAIPLLFRFVPPVPALAANQTVRVVAQTAERARGVPLPAAALTRGATGEQVAWVHVSAERFEARRVEVQALDADRVAVVRGIDAGERVVVSGAALLGQVR